MLLNDCIFYINADNYCWHFIIFITLTFQLLVEVVKLKKLRKDVESEKRLPRIKEKIKKGRFTSFINSKG